MLKVDDGYEIKLKAKTLQKKTYFLWYFDLLPWQRRNRFTLKQSNRHKRN
jgi:hypothetical protein